MSLELALVIRGDNTGASTAVENTATKVRELGAATKEAAAPAADLGEAIKTTAEEAPKAAAGVGDMATAASKAGTDFTNLKTLAIGAIGGIAGALAGAAVSEAFKFATGAAIGYFNEATNSAANIEDDLDRHKQLIADIKGVWDQANGAASNYGLTTRAGLLFESQQNIGRLEADFASELERAAGGLDQGTSPIMLSADLAHEQAPFLALIEQFREDLVDGKADAIAFREEVATIASTLPADDPGRGLAERLLGDWQTAAEVQVALQAAVDLYRSVTGNADAAVRSMGASAEAMAATKDQAAAAIPFLAQYRDIIAQISRADVAGPGPGSFADLRAGFGASGVTGGGFAGGGFTGHGPADQVAGVVHGREYVFDAQSTAAIGVGNLDAIRKGVRGYAGGGYVGSYGGGGSGGSGVVDVFGALQESFYSLRGSIGGLIREIATAEDPIAALGAVAESAGDRILNFTVNALDGLANKAFGAAGNGIFDLVLGAITGSLGGGLGSGAVGRGVYGGGGGFFPAFPGLAGGGDVTSGGWAWTGEQGPELSYHPAGTRVLSSADSMSLLGSSGGAGGERQLHVHFSPVVQGGGDLDGQLRASEQRLWDMFPQIYEDAVRRARIR